MSGKRIKEHKSEMVHDWSSKWFSKCESLMDMTLLVIGNHLSRLLYCLLCGCVVECLSCLFFFFFKGARKERPVHAIDAGDHKNCSAAEVHLRSTAQ